MGKINKKLATVVERNGYKLKEAIRKHFSSFEFSNIIIRVQKLIDFVKINSFYDTIYGS